MDHVLGGYRAWAPDGGAPAAIEQLWRFTPAPARAGGAPAHRVVPYAGTSVVLEVGADGGIGELRLRAYGPLTTTRWFVPRAGVTLLGVRLRVEWTSTVLGLAPGALVDGIVPLPGKLRASWLRAVSGANDPSRLHRTLVALVAGRCVPTDPDLRRVGAAMELLRARGGQAVVEEAARGIEVSPRHLRRLVAEWGGLTPKRMSRIARLERAITSADAQPHPRWSSLAYRHGYADQAHLIRECVDMTGCTPSVLHAERGVGLRGAGVHGGGAASATQA